MSDLNSYVCSNCGDPCYYDGRCGDGPVLDCDCANGPWISDRNGGYNLTKNDASPIHILQYLGNKKKYRR